MEWNPSKFKVLGVWFTNNVNDCVGINYAENFAEVHRLMQLWMKRCITPLGRVAILKSLILSKLIHLWILLPNPPQEFLDNLQKMCFVFVWKEKQDKISRKTAQQHEKNGGMGIPNLNSFIRALKLSWLSKLQSTNHKWKNIAMINYPFLKDIAFYGSKIVDTHKKDNSFWSDVFKSYGDLFDKTEPTCERELMSEPLCFNKRILIGKKVIKKWNWIQKGIWCIGHFFDVHGQFLTFQEFNQKYEVNVNFLNYEGFKRAIMTYMRRFNFQISNNEINEANVCIEKIRSVSKGSQVFYNILETRSERPKCCGKWEVKMNNRNIDWKKCFYYVNKIKDVNMKWFQMRVIHRILGTNIVLKQMGIAQTETCSFCNAERDTIEHLFWYCNVSRAFWDRLVVLINSTCQNAFNFRLTESLVIIGIDEQVKIDSVVAFVILMGKQYLYMCKQKNHNPDVNVFRNRLFYRFRIEEYNARVNSIFNEFSAKWQPYKEFLTRVDS